MKRRGNLKQWPKGEFEIPIFPLGGKNQKNDGKGRTNR
jgi:hypothetical protein